MRIGTFNVVSYLINDSMFPDILAKLQFIPLKVQFEPLMNRYEYTGISPLFRDTEGGPPPFYNLIVQAMEGNILGISAKEWQNDKAFYDEREGCAVVEAEVNQ